MEHPVSYDVLAVQAQRREAAGLKPWAFNIGDDRFELPAEAPADLMPAIAELAEYLDGRGPDDPVPLKAATTMPTLIDALLGPDAERFKKHRLGLVDVAELVLTYLKETSGGSLGESAGSPASSPSTPKTSRPTSKRTTASRSRTTTKAR
jgi:hypothetical protein